MKTFLFYVGLSLIRLLVFLPYSLQLKLGRGLGVLAMHSMKRRVGIADINLKLCFPEYSDSQRLKIRRDSFKSLGMGLMESAMAWFMSQRRFNRISFSLLGLEHYEAALKEKKGILFLGAHFDCLEIIPRFLENRIPAAVVYKKSHHSLLTALFEKARKRYILDLVPHHNMKKMVQILKKREVLWYAPDQDFGASRSVFVPFFHEQAATLRGASLLAQLSGALVLPIFFRRLHNNQGYECEIFPAFDPFPTGNDEVDARAFNLCLEKYIRNCPEQYFWVHRRFKTRPPGEAPLY